MSNRQAQKDRLYLRMAKVWSENCYCERLHVAALIVKDGRIISDGYNGTPHGFENKCEDENGNTHPYVLHAEANAITKVAKSTYSSEGATMYTLVSPCMECSKLIIQAGIVRVCFVDHYRDNRGLQLLEWAGVKIEQVSIDV